SRKIRCSGETDIGCTACRNRSQKCFYDFTAAMGRPRKYPRTEYFGDLSDTLPMELNSHASTLQRGWDDSNLFMRTLQPHEYGQGPPGNGHQVRDLPSSHCLMETIRRDTRYRFQFNPPENVLRQRSFMPTLGGLPLPSGHQSSLSIQNFHESDAVLLNRMLPGPSPATSLGSSMNLHHTAASQAEIPRYYDTEFLHSASSSRRISLDLDLDPISRSLAGGNTNFLDNDLSNSRSPPSLLPHVTNALGDSHEVILTCNAGNIFQHFKGTTIHVTTQAHLQFILREYPNPCSPVPPHKHPSVLNPSFYLYDARGCGLVDCIWASIRFSSDELNLIYSRWLSANPFAFLFNDAAPGQQSIHLAENDAFLATVVGWHFYLRSRSRTYDPPQMPNHHPHDISARCYMPFFEFAEAELMGRAMCVNRLTLSTVQGLVLLGAFRSVDSQPRCGWALLSVAHLLAKEYLSPTNGLKRPRNLNMPQTTWKSLTCCLFRFVQELDIALYEIRKAQSARHGRRLAFILGCIFGVTHASVLRLSMFKPILNGRTVRCSTSVNLGGILHVVPRGSFTFASSGPHSAYLIRWLMDTAKMRCQIMGSYDSPPYTSNRETSASRIFRDIYKNSTSIFRDVLKLLQIISTEGADSVWSWGGLAPTNHARAFPAPANLVSAFAKTMPDSSITSSSDSITWCASCLEFASAGLSLYPLEDFQVIEDARIKVVPLSDTCRHLLKSVQARRRHGPRDPSLSMLFRYGSEMRCHVAPESFEDSVEYVGTKRQRIATNSYPAESINLIGSYLAPIQSSASESTLTCNNGAQPFYPISSTEVGGISSSPLLSDPPSSTSYHLQSGHEPEANKAEISLIPPQGTELLHSISDSQGLINANEMGGTELNSGVFGYPRGTDQYFGPLDSSWINQPPLDQTDLDSHSQNPVLDSFPRTRNPNQLSPPGASRRFYAGIPHIRIDNRALEPQELTEHSSGFQYESFTRLGTPEPAVFTRLAP
ncbi:hypothetical protein PSTT_03795, partial [Puccinia striiformis]